MSSSIAAIVAQRRCVQPATILNWLYFIQSKASFLINSFSNPSTLDLDKLEKKK